MGIIIDSSIMQIKFEKLRNQDYFVDKSDIINKFNDLINKDGSQNVCITKPRRFGKTSIAALLVTYYSKGIDSQKIFDKYIVSKGIDPQELNNVKINFENKDEGQEKEIEKRKRQYKEFQGKYHTLYFDFSHNAKSYDTLEKYLTSINLDLKKDIKKVYPNTEILNDYDSEIDKNLRNLYIETGEQFVIIIDEWDYIISNKLFSYKERDNYIAFLKDLIKDQPYAAFVYMTGILPIAKELNQSTINCFDEYTMFSDEDYYKYFGFTEKEVRDLCNNDEKKYKNLENWYNGYKAFNGDKIFNSWSVYHALSKNKVKNYWTKTGHFDEIINVINFNIDGVKDEVLNLIRGKEISIKLKKYGAEDLQKKSKKSKKGKKHNKMNEKQINDKKKKILYSKMVTFGFLTYYKGKISIPNKELKEEFIEALSEDDEMEYYYDLIKISKKMLKSTFEKNAEKMCKILEKAHLKKKKKK